MPEEPESIRELTFSGQGTFTISKDKISCDLPMIVEELSNKSLLIRGKPAISGGTGIVSSFRNSGVFNFGRGLTVTGTVDGVSVTGDGSNTVIQMKGNRFEMLNDGKIKLNQRRYAPYTIRKGRYAGQKFFLPEGFGIVDEDGKEIIERPYAEDVEKLQKEVEEAAKREEESKEYKFKNGAVAELERITASGQVDLKIDKSAIDGKDLEIEISGQSSVKLEEKVRLSKILRVMASGQSAFKGPAIAQYARLTATGQSSIRGIHSIDSCTANATGMSSIKGSAEPGASLSSHKSGMASSKIVRSEH